MSIIAKVNKDSIGPAGVRLTTFVLTYPRMIHAELMTHRMASKSSASSRAIPAKKMRDRILENPALPVWWGKNQSGMQALEEVEDTQAFKDWWLAGLDFIAKHHEEGERRGYHKQIVNRIIEPWMHIEVVFTVDQYGLSQLFHQRRHKDAQPEFQALANAMWEGLEASEPDELQAGWWHLPFIETEDELGAIEYTDETMPGASVKEKLAAWWSLLKAISVGRCARASYLNHEGKRAPQDDVALHDRLKVQVPGHWAPFEHVAQALETPTSIGNLTGWKQYRKEFPNEYLTSYPETK